MKKKIYIYKSLHINLHDDNDASKRTHTYVFFHQIKPEMCWLIS